MSADSETEAKVAAEKCCANCGIAEIDDIKLTPCNKCDLVSYCSDECQLNHKEIHLTACNKLSAELRDEILFRQPESSHLGDCPICCLPLPTDEGKSRVNGCCGMLMCAGCTYTKKLRSLEQGLENKCPFCRKVVPETEEEADEYLMERAEKNGPCALGLIGVKKFREGDIESAFNYSTKAAQLGDANAHFYLSAMYGNGIGVAKDEDRMLHHLEQAAVGGHVKSRYLLGMDEIRKDRYDRAVKHLMISASFGDGKSLEVIKDCYIAGFVCKEKFATALRAHQAAVDSTKSPQREAADKFFSRIEKEMKLKSSLCLSKAL